MVQWRGTRAAETGAPLPVFYCGVKAVLGAILDGNPVRN
jgi:hypothetical protein